MLDEAGEHELTVRALTDRLATGRGAIYHHVSGKAELLRVALDSVVVGVIAGTVSDDSSLKSGDPVESIRSLAVGIFDAIDSHPWVGRQLVAEPLQPAVVRIWKVLGLHLQQFGVPAGALSDAGSALMSYVLGAAAQYVEGARHLPDDVDRESYLKLRMGELVQDDTDPIMQQIADQLVSHDDRGQFLAGVDIFLRGIEQQVATRRSHP